MTRSRRLRLALVVFSLAAASAFGARPLVARSGEPAEKGTAPMLAEDAAVDAPAAAGAVPSPDPAPVPATAEPPAGGTCPDGWAWFENPALHYGLCVPPGWGFTDFSSPAPMTMIPGRQLAALRLVSGRAFPWEPGVLPFDAVRDRGMIDVELTLLEAGLSAAEECEPASPLTVGAVQHLACEQRYDSLGLPALGGSLTATKIVIPLLQPPTGLSAAFSGARLLVIVRTSTGTQAEEVDLLWRAIESITAS